MLDRIAKFFCSLRLTVVLLGAGLVLVFVGTLAQVHEGLFAAQVRYFKSWYIWKPTIGDHAWPILLPGGYLLGTMLLLNLLAAHVKRFQLTRKKIGINLIHAGIVLLLLGQLGTDMLSQESSMYLTEGKSANFSEDFRANELVFEDTSDPTADRIVSIPESLVAEKGEIRDPALPVTVRVRNYWQNCDVQEIPPANAIHVAANQGIFTNYAVVPLAADSQSDDARAAVLVEVISPKGSLGTFFVPSKMGQGEQQTFSYADQDWELSCTFAPAMGGNQLVVAKAGDMGGDSMMMFPDAELKRQTDIKREGFPLTFRVKNYWPGCRLYRTLTPNSIQPKVNSGVLAGTFVTPLANVTDSEHRNFPGAVVELFSDKGSLGTWLLWARPEQADLPRFAEIVNVGAKTYRMVFQFTRYYKPCSLGLTKFSHDQYKGTTIPKNFSSRVRIVNPNTKEDREVLIKMNTPLRYDGITYYQASFDQNRPDATILEVVKNPGWLTPYLACVIVGVGLIVQFMSHLIGFVTKRKTA